MREFSHSFDLTPRPSAGVLVSDTCVSMETLEQAQGAMLGLPDAKTDFTDQTSHHFTRGVYGRHFTMPAGQTVMSKIHKYSCFFVILKGELAIAGNQGRRIVRTGDWFITEAGAKRCVHAITDVECMTFHGTNETDLDALEAELIMPESTKTLPDHECDLLGVY